MDSGGPVCESTDEATFKIMASDLIEREESKLSDMKKFKRAKRLMPELKNLLAALLEFLATNHKRLFDWIVDGDDKIELSHVLEELQTQEVDEAGFCVYALQLRVDDPKALHHMLSLDQSEKRQQKRSIDDFMYYNDLQAMDAPAYFSYVGQCSTTTSTHRLGQHLAGKSGAVLVETVVNAAKNQPGSSVPRYVHRVLVAQQQLRMFAQHVILDIAEVTNWVEVFLMHLLGTCVRQKKNGLNIADGSFYGNNSDAAAAGRENLSFSPSVLAQLASMFTTAHRCQNPDQPCERALKKHDDVFYSLCQSCEVAKPETSFIVARLIRSDEGVESVVAHGEGIPHNQAVAIRREACQQALQTYAVNNLTRQTCYERHSLVQPLETAVRNCSCVLVPTRLLKDKHAVHCLVSLPDAAPRFVKSSQFKKDSTTCEHDVSFCREADCRNRRLIEFAHVDGQGKTNDSFKFTMFALCCEHKNKYTKAKKLDKNLPDLEYVRAKFDINTREWVLDENNI